MSCVCVLLGCFVVCTTVYRSPMQFATTFTAREYIMMLLMNIAYHLRMSFRVEGKMKFHTCSLSFTSYKFLLLCIKSS